MSHVRHKITIVILHMSMVINIEAAKLDVLLRISYMYSREHFGGRSIVFRVQLLKQLVDIGQYVRVAPSRAVLTQQVELPLPCCADGSCTLSCHCRVADVLQITKAIENCMLHL